MGRGSRRSQGQTQAAISTVTSRHFYLLYRGAVPQGLPASLKYNKVSGSETLQKSQGLVPDSISRSVGPCRSSQYVGYGKTLFTSSCTLHNQVVYINISIQDRKSREPPSKWLWWKVPKPGGFGMKFPAVSRAGIEEERCFKARPLKIFTECLVLDCVWLSYR